MQTFWDKTKRYLTSTRFFCYIIIALGLLFTTVMQGRFDGLYYLHVSGDNARYIAMSQQWFASVDYPFALRLFSPSIAHSLMHWGMSPDGSWLLLTYVASFFGLVFIFKILADYYKLSYFTSLLCALLAMFTYWFTQFNFNNFILVDPVNNLVYAASLYYALRQRIIPFTIVLLVGITNKEVAIFMAPLFALIAWTKQDKTMEKRIWQGILALVILVLGYVIFRHWAASHISQLENVVFGGGPNGLSLVQNVVFSLSENTNIYIIYHILDFLWPIALWSGYLLYRRQGIRQELVVTSILLVLTFTFGRFFATDAERVFAPITPLVVVLCGVFFDQFKDDRRRFLLLLMLFAFMASQLNWISQDSDLFVQVIFLAVFSYEFLPVKKLEV